MNKIKQNMSVNQELQDIKNMDKIVEIQDIKDIKDLSSIQRAFDCDNEHYNQTEAIVVNSLDLLLASEIQEDIKNMEEIEEFLKIQDLSPIQRAFDYFDNDNQYGVITIEFWDLLGLVLHFNNDIIDLISYFLNIDEIYVLKYFMYPNIDRYLRNIMGPMGMKKSYLSMEKSYQKFPDDSRLIWAARNGYLEILMYFNSIGYQYAEDEEDPEQTRLIYELSGNLDIHAKNDEAFRLCCANGHLEPAKLIFGLDGQVDMYAMDEYVFKHSYKNGHFEIFKWLLALVWKIDADTVNILFDWIHKMGYLNTSDQLWFGTNIDSGEDRLLNIHGHDVPLFRKSCEDGRLDISKLLLGLNVKLNIHAGNEIAFRSSCINNHPETAKWLFELDGKIDIHVFDDNAFRCCCGKGLLKMAKWLFGLDNRINIHARNEEPFRYSCRNGYLGVSRWLYGLDGKINIYVHNEDAFRYSYRNGHLEIFSWLLGLVWKIDADIIDILFDWIIRNRYLDDSIQLWFGANGLLNIHGHNVKLFHKSCESGRLYISKFLFKINGKIDIYAEDGYLFRNIREYSPEVQEWLLEIDGGIWEIIRDIRSELAKNKGLKEKLKEYIRDRDTHD